MDRIDVGGGLSLAVEVTGAGMPPVVCVSGLNDDRHVWKSLLSALTEATTTMTYDRPGLGDSDHLPPDLAAVPRSYADAANQLRTLLDAAGVPGPRVLVGHSVGGLIVHLYAARMPDDVAGLVYVDATDPDLHVDAEGFGPTAADSYGGLAFDWAMGRDEARTVTLPAVPAVVVASSAGRWASVKSPEKYAPYSLAEVDERWQQWQRDLAIATGAALIVAHDADHYVHTEAPALVAYAVDAVVRAVRTGGDPRLDLAVVDTAGGALTS